MSDSFNAHEILAKLRGKPSPSVVPADSISVAESSPPKRVVAGSTGGAPSFSGNVKQQPLIITKEIKAPIVSTLTPAQRRENLSVRIELEKDIKRLQDEVGYLQRENAQLRADKEAVDQQFIAFKVKSEDTISRLRSKIAALLNVGNGGTPPPPTLPMPIHSLSSSPFAPAAAANSSSSSGLKSARLGLGLGSRSMSMYTNTRGIGGSVYGPKPAGHSMTAANSASTDFTARTNNGTAAAATATTTGAIIGNTQQQLGQLGYPKQTSSSQDQKQSGGGNGMVSGQQNNNSNFDHFGMKRTPSAASSSTPPPPPPSLDQGFRDPTFSELMRRSTAEIPSFKDTLRKPTSLKDVAAQNLKTIHRLEEEKAHLQSQTPFSPSAAATHSMMRRMSAQSIEYHAQHKYPYSSSPHSSALPATTAPSAIAAAARGADERGRREMNDLQHHHQQQQQDYPQSYNHNHEDQKSDGYPRNEYHISPNSDGIEEQMDRMGMVSQSPAPASRGSLRRSSTNSFDRAGPNIGYPYDRSSISQQLSQPFNTPQFYGGDGYDALPYSNNNNTKDNSAYPQQQGSEAAHRRRYSAAAPLGSDAASPHTQREEQQQHHHHQQQQQPHGSSVDSAAAGRSQTANMQNGAIRRGPGFDAAGGSIPAGGGNDSGMQQGSNFMAAPERGDGYGKNSNNIDHDNDRNGGHGSRRDASGGGDRGNGFSGNHHMLPVVEIDLSA